MLLNSDFIIISNNISFCSSLDTACLVTGYGLHDAMESIDEDPVPFLRNMLLGLFAVETCRFLFERIEWAEEKTEEDDEAEKNRLENDLEQNLDGTEQEKKTKKQQKLTAKQRREKKKLQMARKNERAEKRRNNHTVPMNLKGGTGASKRIDPSDFNFPFGTEDFIVPPASSDTKSDGSRNRKIRDRQKANESLLQLSWDCCRRRGSIGYVCCHGDKIWTVFFIMITGEISLSFVRFFLYLKLGVTTNWFSWHNITLLTQIIVHVVIFILLFYWLNTNNTLVTQFQQVCSIFHPSFMHP